MLKAYKYRLYPNKQQEILIQKTFGCARFIYNKMLSDKIEYYKETGKMLYNTPAQYKKEFEWLKEVDSLALANAQLNLDKAYKNFFKNKSVGFPKFKSKKSNRFSYTTNNNNKRDTIYIKDNYIKLPKLKSMIKIKYHRKFTGTIKSCTVSKNPSGKYFVSILVDTENIQLPKNNNSIGLDLGIKSLLITSDGVVYDNKKYTYRYEKQLAKLQRQLAKKKKGSNNYNKQRIKIAKLYEKIANTRRDNLHKISSEIVKDNQFIFSEDLNIQGMLKNSRLSKAISDCGWYELTRQLQYKAEWNGRVYMKVNRFYPSSQLCNKCGYKNTDTKGTKGLGIRYWECPECGEIHDRDINASINVLKEGLRILEM